MTRSLETLEQGNIPPNRQPYRLLIARLEAGMKQQELAELMGVGRTIVSDAEKGKGPVRKIYLNAWALATGVPISWLEHGTGGSQPPENRPTNPDAVRPKGLEPPTFWLEAGNPRQRGLTSVKQLAPKKRPPRGVGGEAA